MRGFRKNIIEIALFLTCMMVLTVHADVKLRIYMQDGTLQAGNLVSETKESFVILTKEGRLEVPKNRIMFVNGKTLKQWEQRPDQLFQTEIIPSDIPNPAYVNDKAKNELAPLPKIKPLADLKSVLPAMPSTPAPTPKPSPTPAPTPTPKPTPQAPPAAVVATPTPVPAVPPTPTPVEKQEIVTKSPEPDTKKETPKAVSKTVARLPDQEKKTVVTETKKPKDNLRKRKRFDRDDLGQYHYDRAIVYLTEGEKGAAMQELHMSVLLDRRHAEPVRELGRLYMEQGLFDRAEKYFNHPSLKKNDEVKKWLDEIEIQKKDNHKKQLTLYYGTGVALFMILPLWALVRRIKIRPRPQKRIITADNAEEFLELASPVLTATSPESHNPATEAMPIPTDLKPEPPMTQKRLENTPPPMSAPPPSPRVPNPISPEPEPLAPPPPPPPPAIYVPMEPVLPLDPRGEGLPVPSIEEVLVAGTLVDEAMQRGNQYALEGWGDKARREYRTALALNPSCLDAHLGLAFLGYSQGQWDLALEHYIRALQINPSSPDVHYGIGCVLVELHREDEAVPRFQMALKLDPTFEDARDCLTSLGKAV